MDRKDFLKKGSLLAAGGMLLSKINSFAEQPFLNTMVDNGKYSLPALPYSNDALEPFIDKITMEIHHTKHHQAYVNNLNKALETADGNMLGSSQSFENIFNKVSKMHPAVRNNAGGHYNHSLFWQLMKPNGGGEPTGKIAEAIKNSFGSFEEFKKKFHETAITRFGSGWAWLVVDKNVLDNNVLKIGSTPNQDNPLMDLPAGQAGVSEFKGKPVLALDVWEHAYYLKHQNKRADYINDWWNVVNWDQVNTLFLDAIK